MTLNGRLKYEGTPDTEGCFAFGELREEWSNNNGVPKDGTKYSKAARRLMAQVNWRLRKEGLKKKMLHNLRPTNNEGE